ncbi:MAG: TIGR03621 family F420-dependent LLM class oxidoreductase [Acidimicrobiales bacterium]|nr:TIGR03621 family F420-dependent LLM class oxidoreductase [Acidimicrobiales bacterium]
MTAPSPRPFRFSLQGSGISSPAEWTELARKAEDLGYSALSMSDHFDDQFAPLIGLTAAAAATTDLRLLTLVLANDYRHPVLLAKEAASLDLFSSGRLELGIGAGWMQADYEGAGLAYDRPGIRIERLGEAVTVVKGLLRAEPFQFAGEHYQVDMTGYPAPHQRPHPPIMIAGGGRKILSLAGQHADIVGLNPGLAAGVIDHRAGPTATANATDQKLAWIKAAAAERFPAIELQTRIHLAMITDDRDAVAEAMAGALGLTTDEAKTSPHQLVGSVNECIETLHAWRERWGITYIGLSHAAIDDMAPVVAALTGA